MNEDEAFIRAIVDTPGDDTARLVYADWLDDRDDPRGTYLRTEHEWKRTGKKVKSLRTQAKKLEPVWVYRVSRPPFGVCLPSGFFETRGPNLTTEEMAHVVSYDPPELAALLMNYNGGELTQELQDALSDEGITNFASYNAEDSLTIKELEDSLIHPGSFDRVLDGYTPFAYTQAGFGRYNCLLLGDAVRDTSKKRSKNPAVVYYRNPGGFEWSEEDIRELADDEDDDEDEIDVDRIWETFDVERFLSNVAPDLLTFLATLTRESE